MSDSTPDPASHPTPDASPAPGDDSAALAAPADALPAEEPQPSVVEAAPPEKVITEFNISEEFGTAKRNLPPARIVIVSVVAVAIVLAIIAFVRRPKPQGAGSIRFVSAAEVPSRSMVLAAITFTLRNTADKSLWIHTLKAEITLPDGHTYEDDAASAVDFDRYFQLFPSLKESSEPPLPPETKLPPGTEKSGTIIVSFPIPKDTFDQRKALTVTIQPYDEPLPIVLK